MNMLLTLSVGTRLRASFAISILFLVALAVVGAASLRAVNSSLHVVVDDRYVKVKTVTHIKEELNFQARATRKIVIFDGAEKIAGQLEEIATSQANVRDLYAALDASIASDDLRQARAQVEQFRVRYLDEYNKFAALVKADNMALAKPQLVNQLRDAQLAYMSSLDQFTKLNEGLMTEAATNADRVVNTSIWVVAGLGLGAAFLALLLAQIISRSITVPLGRALEIAESVARGDLRSRFDKIPGDDEAAKLLRALNRMNDSLVNIVGSVRSASESIATGSSEIATGNADLSQRTEEQASNLQQTAASMEELKTTVANNAERSRDAARLAASAAEVAAQGGSAMRDVVQTMEAISTSSGKISEIIGVIDGIAFQTNILALNAAVEAARAGQQGRGFAVVASEVRSLAQRSAAAALEIKALIAESAETVDAGNRLVEGAGRTMSDTVARVQDVNELITEISTSNGEQSVGIGQVGDAVGQLDQVTQQNAALVEQSAAAAESLRHQATQLAQLVGKFSL
jgi:methyl-accepting chemotaxis protein